MDDDVLVLEGFGVSFGEQLVLADVSLRVPRIGVFVLLGPAGAGKSTLLRTVAGLNDAKPALHTWGLALLDGEPLGPDNRPAIVMQDARLLTSSVRENLVSGIENRASLSQLEQTALVLRALARSGLEEVGEDLGVDVLDLPLVVRRRLAVVRGALSGSAVLCIDEPTVGLDDGDTALLLEHIRHEAKERAVLLVTHDQRFARAAGGIAALLAGGRVQEVAPIEKLLDAPETEAGRSFASTGRCRVPAPDARREDLASDVPPPAPLPPAVKRIISAMVGPRDFFWVDDGRLGGVPRPGIVATLEHDLEALKRLGVTLLVTLEETLTVDGDALARHEIGQLFFPIVDMEAPSVDAAIAHCQEIEDRIDDGDIVAIHCRAGLGRTGTMLACQLVYRGVSALSAIERVRRVRPRSIQSDPQVELITMFARELHARADETHSVT